MSDLLAAPLTCPRAWTDLTQDDDALRLLETSLLPPYFNTCRWFAGKARPQETFRVKVTHTLALPDGGTAYLLVVEVSYADGGEAENYQLPLGFLDPQSAGEINAKALIGVAYFGERRGLLVDALYDERFQHTLFAGMATNQTLRLPAGTLHFQRGKGLAPEDLSGPITSRVLPVDSSNSALVFGGPSHGEKYFFKLYRKLFRETNPEVELVSFLTEESSFAHIPAFAGSLTWQRPGGAPPDAPDVTLGLMQRMVENQHDAWVLTGQQLGDFVLGVRQGVFSVREEVFEWVDKLGRRTGELHCSLYAPRAGTDFHPEPFTDQYRQFLHERFAALLDRRYQLLIDTYLTLDAPTQRLAWTFMEAKERIDAFVADVLTRPMESLRTRIHGDYHLGQVLATTNDYVIIDFEGEPESSIAERKIKHSPLKDVAGMIRSYHYAISAALFTNEETAQLPPERLQRVADRWYRLMKDTFLDAYFEEFGWPHPLFRDQSEINYLLLLYLLEKAVYELGYELSYRPDWVKIPLKGIVDVIGEIEKLRV
jgi:maltose alpha-D-glucosyltransferase/alpha-amylase